LACEVRFFIDRALTVAREFTRKFKRAEAGLISILQEVEESRLFLDLGITSLFQYAVKSLGLSEDVAFNFITVSRKAKQMPILQEAILENRLELKRVQDLESKRTARAVSMEEALRALLSLYLETKDPQKRAERVLKNAAKRPVSGREKQLSQSDNPRAIPARQKHQLIARDQGQCTHGDNEKRCENRRWTHTHHVIPRSVGGDHSLESFHLRL
jgi:hypothetical protein